MVTKDSDKLVMSVVEAGALLGCARSKAYALAKDGTLPTIKLHGRLVVPKQRFINWLNGQMKDEDAI